MDEEAGSATWARRPRPAPAAPVGPGRRGPPPGRGGAGHGPLLHRLRPALAALAAALCPVLLGGCRVDVTTGLEGHPDGSGRVAVSVSLDRAAAEQVPDLARQLRIDDLRRAGWVVHGPRPAAGGGVAVEAVKRFTTAAGAARAAAELSGPGGPLRDVRLSRQRSFLRTRTALTARADLRSGLESFSDPVLRERLGGAPFGVDLALVERQVGVSVAQVFRFRVVARLPGRISANGATTGEGAVWQPRLGETQVLEASSEQWNTAGIASASAAALSGLALMVVLVRRSRHVSWT